MIVRLQPEPRAAIEILLARIDLLTMGGEAELAQFGQQRHAPGFSERRPGAPFVLVVAFPSTAVAERFLCSNADLLAAAIEGPLFFEPSEHGTSNVLPPIFA